VEDVKGVEYEAVIAPFLRERAFQRAEIRAAFRCRHDDFTIEYGVVSVQLVGGRDDVAEAARLAIRTPQYLAGIAWRCPEA
jgi:hypothetical protein